MIMLLISTETLYNRYVGVFNSELDELMNGPIREKLKVIPHNVTWQGQSELVFEALSADFMTSSVKNGELIETLDNFNSFFKKFSVYNLWYLPTRLVFPYFFFSVSPYLCLSPSFSSTFLICICILFTYSICIYLVSRWWLLHLFEPNRNAELYLTLPIYIIWIKWTHTLFMGIIVQNWGPQP